MVMAVCLEDDKTEFKSENDSNVRSEGEHNQQRKSRSEREEEHRHTAQDDSEGRGQGIPDRVIMKVNTVTQLLIFCFWFTLEWKLTARTSVNDVIKIQ